MPSVGESSSPRMDSSVDLPQPEGPAIEMYVPFLISRCISSSAWVSTSSVKKTFFTPSILMSVPFASAIASPLNQYSCTRNSCSNTPGASKSFSLIAQRHQRIDVCRAPRGQIRRGQCNKNHHQQRAAHGQKLEGFHSIQHGIYQFAQAVSQRQTQQNADPNEPRHVIQNHSADFPCVRAKCHAHADLSRTLRYG